METTEKKSASVAKTAAAKPKFPRDIVIVNETPTDYVVARTFVAKHSEVKVTVKDEDEITRIKTDCKHITGLLDHAKDAEVDPVRVSDAA